MIIEGITIHCAPEEVHAVRGRWKRANTFSVHEGETLCKMDLAEFAFPHRHGTEKCMNIVGRSQVTCLVCLAADGPTPARSSTSRLVPELAGV